MAEENKEAAEKVRENRVRRMLMRQGLLVQKSRAKDPLAIGYGGYMIIDRDRNVIAGGGELPYSMTLDDVERFALEGHGVRLAKERAAKRGGK